MIFFITKFVICVTKFVIRVTKFVTHISKFVTNFFWRMVKTIKGLGKTIQDFVKIFCLKGCEGLLKGLRSKPFSHIFLIYSYMNAMLKG